MFAPHTSKVLIGVCALAMAVTVAPLQADSVLSPGLRSLIVEQLNQHPTLLAADAAVDAAHAHVQAAGRPLYNPELELDGQRTTINTFQVGVSQSFDINDKGLARMSLAEAGLNQARAQRAVIRIELAGELLSALLGCTSSQSLLALSQEQSDLLNRFYVLIQRRGSAGDVALSEVQLANLAKVEAVLNQARQQAEVQAADQSYMALSERACPSITLFPNVPPQETMSDDNIEQQATTHPRVQSALALAKTADAQTLSIDRDRKADPTLGVRLGREDKDSLIGLTLSMPLNVMNDFRSEVDAQRAIAQGSYATAKQVYRQLRADISGSQSRLRTLNAAWQDWQASEVSGNTDSGKALERVWRAGELSTADYLQQLQQNLNTRIAAESLRGDLWRAWVDLQRANGSLAQSFERGVAQ